jgi:hypothetical protein
MSTQRPSLTFDLLDSNKDKLATHFKEYVGKLTNRAMYKPECDNVFIQHPSVNDTDILAIVKVSIIETILKPMTFIMCWKVHTAGWLEAFDDGSRPSAYAREMFRPYTQAVSEWIEQVRYSVV